MSEKVLSTLERWIAVITSVIAIAGAIKSVYVFLVQTYPAKWADYLILFITFMAFILAVYLFLKPKQRPKYEFLPNVDDVEQQAKVTSSTRQVRFRGLRFYEALRNENFTDALKFPQEIKLHVMAKYAAPINDLEKEHNRKYDKVILLLKSLRANNVKIIVKESSGCPEYNISIFDSTLVRRRKYNQVTMSAKNSQAQIFHWEHCSDEIKRIIQDYDKEWEKASYVNLD